MDRTVLFVGVTTGQSIINRLFPRWMDEMGIAARIEGVDLPLDAGPHLYRAVVERIAGDGRIAGAVVTTHKLRLYEAAHDLFAGADPLATLCREVNGISKRGTELIAHALDPLSCRATLDTMLGAAYWIDHDADVLCLGTGGAATAVAVSLLCDLEAGCGELAPSRAIPHRLLFVDIEEARLRGLRRVIETARPDAPVEYHNHESSAQNGALLQSLAPESLVINATGMGKDRPGSPLTSAATFPECAVVWDLNYRGRLTFLNQAGVQQRSRRLQVHDGWLLFLHGWTAALSVVLSCDMAGSMFPRLAAIAEEVRANTQLPLHGTGRSQT
ncbi:MAG TPA: shikimate dehydrogenase [Chloroflexota bacterium]|nr:shikimate dehydrogenase [Chloroflexota bacterium]